MPLIFTIFADWVIDPLIKWPVVRLFHIVRDLWVSTRTSDWYIVQGTVVTLHAKQKGRFWHVQLAYRYSAETHNYCAMWRRLFIFEREVDRFMDKHPTGSHIRVRYRPGRISQSAILDADQSEPMRQDQPLTD